MPEDGVATADLLGALEARLEPDDVVRRRRSKLVRTRRPVLGDALSELRASDALTTDTPWSGVRRCCRARRRRARLRRKAHSRAGRALAELRAVAESEGPFRADELPGELDAESRLVLLRRLIREGFVRRSAADG